MIEQFFLDGGTSNPLYSFVKLGHSVLYIWNNAYLHVFALYKHQLSNNNMLPQTEVYLHKKELEILIKISILDLRLKY